MKHVDRAQGEIKAGAEDNATTVVRKDILKSTAGKRSDNRKKKVTMVM